MSGSQNPHYSMSLVPFLHRVVERENLSAEEAQAAMESILSGGASAAQIGAFLTALRMKGETVEELVGCARAMRKLAAGMASMVAPGEQLVDTCGTGGGGPSTFNISTVAAFVAAGAGVRVAKHGNRAISSRCGSADLLERLGVKVSIGPDRAAQAIREVGVAFLFAPDFHGSMRHAQPVRRELKLRTIFNMLGPLTNPAGATAQVVGAVGLDVAGLMANALQALGLRRGFVVHGADGLDEISTTGPTTIFEIGDGGVQCYSVEPEACFGLPRASVEALQGGDPETNCAIALEILRGAPGPKRDIVLANAAAALVAAGRAGQFREGVLVAARSIDSGAALAKLEQLARFTQQ